MSDTERLATVHVLQTPRQKAQRQREYKQYVFEASGQALQHVLRALLGRLKWHATRLDNPYGYAPLDPVPEFEAHMALGMLAAEIEAQLNCDGWDTGDAQTQLHETSPAMWACYQQYEAGQQVTGKYTEELEQRAQAQRQAYVQAKASAKEAARQAKAAAKPSAKAARVAKASREDRRAYRAAEAEAKHLARVAKRDAQKGKL